MFQICAKSCTLDRGREHRVLIVDPHDPAVAPGRFDAAGARASPVGCWIEALDDRSEATALIDYARLAIDIYQISNPNLGRSIDRRRRDCRAGTCAKCSPTARPTSGCCFIEVDCGFVRSSMACFRKADRAALAQGPGVPTGRRAGHRLP
jgi:hypothetical protein